MGNFVENASPSADARLGAGRRAPAGGRRRRSGSMVWQTPVGEGHAWQTPAGGSRCGERPAGSKLAVASLAAAGAAGAGREVGGGGAVLGLVVFRRRREAGVPPARRLRAGRQVVARARLAQPGG